MQLRREHFVVLVFAISKDDDVHEGLKYGAYPEMQMVLTLMLRHFDLCEPFYTSTTDLSWDDNSDGVAMIGSTPNWSVIFKRLRRPKDYSLQWQPIHSPRNYHPLRLVSSPR